MFCIEMVRLVSGSKIGLFGTRLVHLCILFTIVMTFFVLAAALVFRETEPQWNFFEALYFSIITVSTVGLGDYVPGYDVYGFSREAYLIFCCGQSTLKIPLKINDPNYLKTSDFFLSFATVPTI